MKKIIGNFLAFIFLSSQFFLLIYKLFLVVLFGYADISWALTVLPAGVALVGVLIFGLVKFKNRNKVTLGEFYNQLKEQLHFSEFSSSLKNSV